MGNCRIDYCKMNLSIKNAKTGKKRIWINYQNDMETYFLTLTKKNCGGRLNMWYLL